MSTDYNGKTIKYIAFPDKEVLLNTQDVCKVLGIKERPGGTILGETSIDIGEATINALSKDINNIDFAEWLQETFIGYKMAGMQSTLVKSYDKEWNF